MPSGFGPREPVPTSCACPSLPVGQQQIVSVDLEQVGGQVEHLATHVVGCCAYGRRDRWGRLRTPRDRREDAVAGRPRLDPDAIEREPELLGGDLSEHGRRPRADVLRARDDGCDAVRTEPHERVRRRTAAAPPDLAGGPEASHPAVGGRVVGERVPIAPAGQLGRALHRPLQVLGAVRQAALLIDIDRVPPPQLERIEVEHLGQLVDDLLEAERPLHHAGSTECVREAEVEAHGKRRGAHVLAAVERRGRRQHGRDEQAAHAHRDHGGRIDGGQRAIAAGADAVRLDGGWPMPGRDRLGAALVDQADRTAGNAREVRSEQSLIRRALLPPEASAHELAGHVHEIGLDAEALRELVAGVEDALGRDPDAELVLGPVGDRAVRFERLLHVRGRAVLGLDDHVGLGEARLDVAPLILRGILGEALLGEPLLEIDHEPERFPARSERGDATRGGRGIGGRERRDGSSGVLGLGGQHLLAGERRGVSRSRDREHARDGTGSLEIERDARMCVRRAQHDGLEHAREPDVRDEACVARHALGARDARRRGADHGELRRVGPRLDVVLGLDEHPALLEAT
jgi:hypothetical protein